MAYERKTVDEYDLQINYGLGDGWEDTTTETTYREIRQRQREYRENCPEYPTRIRKRRVPKEEVEPAPASNGPKL